jgi:hypothetical protein
MSEPKTLSLDIYLDYWIIADGNYHDFRVGEKRKFALEIWAPSLLTRTTERTISLRQERDHSYGVSGRLVFAADGVWVIDCGVLAYSERERHEVDARCTVGDFVRGDVKFGVDPFFYFEQHCKIPGIPALIYEWQINSIEQDTTPYILSDASGSRMYVRDETRSSCKAVYGTDKNFAIPSEHCSAFVLSCTKLDTEQRHKV